MLCQFLLYNKVNQLYVYIYPHIPSLLHLPPTLPIPPLQGVTKHRADLPVLYSCFPLAIFFFLILFIYLFIYFWLCWVPVSVRGLFSLVVASRGHSSSRCVGLSLLWPLLLRSTGSRRAGSVGVGSRAQLLRGMWDPPGPGLEPMSPAFAGRLSSTAPPGKPQLSILHLVVYICQCYSLTSSQLTLPPPHVLKSILYVCVFIPVLPLGSSERFCFFFHSIYICQHTVFVFLFLTYFTLYDTLGPSTSTTNNSISFLFMAE